VSAEARRVICRYLDRHRNQCTAEAVDELGEVLVCEHHLAMAMALLHRQTGLVYRQQHVRLGVWLIDYPGDKKVAEFVMPLDSSQTICLPATADSRIASERQYRIEILRPGVCQVNPGVDPV
jgi:hypothetical protein